MSGVRRRTSGVRHQASDVGRQASDVGLRDFGPQIFAIRPQALLISTLKLKAEAQIGPRTSALGPQPPVG